MKRSRNIKVEHGKEAFFTDAIALFHNNSKFIFDFKQSTPRIDQFDDKTHETVVVKHNTILMDPLTAKMFMKILEENISNWEKKFGELNIPEQKKKVEKKREDFSYIA